jgi:hypothetical protein
MTDRHETEHKSFGSPDETRELPHVFEGPGDVTSPIESSRHGRIQGGAR